MGGWQSRAATTTEPGEAAMTAPMFVAEMTAQLTAARRELASAWDAEAAASAAARLADLLDIAARAGADLSHIDGLAPAD